MIIYLFKTTNAQDTGAWRDKSSCYRYKSPFSAEGIAKCCATITVILSSGLFPEDTAKEGRIQVDLRETLTEPNYCTSRIAPGT